MEPRALPLIGRLDELEGLTAAFERARAGAGGVRFISGEPGIGKSRLVDALAELATDRGCMVLRGWAAEHEHARPFGLAMEVFRSGSEEFIDAARLAIAAPSDHRVVDELVDLVEAATSDHPLLLVFEDLHWADPLSIRFLVSLGIRAPMMPLLILATMRPIPRSPSLARATAKLVDQGAELVDLDGLGAGDVASLAACLLGEPPASSLSDYLRGAGGNPLFVTELIAALGAQSSLVHGVHGVEALEPGLPPSLRLTILRRLDHLSAELIEVLRIATVLGSAFSVRELSTVTGRPSTELVPLLDEALRAGVLMDRLERLAFRHDVLHESIYQDLPVSVRRALHREFADLLAAAGAETSTVAEHLGLGAELGDTQAIGWLLDVAARYGEESHAAVPLLERARSLCTPDAEELATILARLSLPYAFMGRLEESAEAAARSLALAPLGPDAAQAHAALAAAKIIAGGLAEGVEELLTVSSTEGYPLADRAEALATAAYFSVFCLEPEKAISRARTALAMTEGTVPAAECRAVGALALATMATGSARDALALARRARAYELPHGGTQGFDLALVSLLCNDLDSARDIVRDDLVSLTGTGNEGTLPVLHFSMAMIHYLAGHLDAAVAEAATGQTLSDELETSIARTFGRAIAALIALHRDELDVAGSVLGQAVAELEQSGPQFGLDLLLLAQALNGEATGEREAARTWLLGAWDLPGPIRALSMGQLIAPELLGSIVGTDDTTASRVVAQLEEMAERNPAPVPIGIAKLGRAMLDRDGDLAQAGVEIHRRAGFVLPHARVCELAAEVLVEGDRIGEAAPLLGRALDIWEAANASREEARVAALLRSIGIRRRRASRPQTTKSGWDALTPTELKVAHLVADGLTSREVGARLFISRRTVETHLSHIFAKLGVSNRSQVAAIVGSR